MQKAVRCEVALLVEGFVAQLALERLFRCVNNYVPVEVFLSGELSEANLAGERLLTSVGAVMDGEAASVDEQSVAFFTWEFRFAVIHDVKVHYL